MIRGYLSGDPELTKDEVRTTEIHWKNLTKQQRKDRQTIARFMGWEPVVDVMPLLREHTRRWGSSYWVQKGKHVAIDFYRMYFETKYEWFVPAWNKAVAEFSPELKRRVAERKKAWILADEDKIFRALNDLPQSFSIPERLPILIDIINFLNNPKP